MLRKGRVPVMIPGNSQDVFVVKLANPMPDFSEWKSGQTAKLLPRLVDSFKGQAIVTDNSLVVKGLKPYANLDIQLSPYIYIITPDYWQIEVLAFSPQGGILLPAITPFETEPLNLSRVLGNVGIEVIWQDESEQIDISKDVFAQFAGGSSDILTFLTGRYQVKERFRYPCPELLDPLKTCPAELKITFTHPRIDEVIGAVRDCAAGAALAALVTAAIAFAAAGTGLGAATGVFETAFKACLIAKGVDFANDIGVSVDVRKL